MKNQPVASSTLYPRDIVFAAACAAQRINGEYVKRSSAQYPRHNPNNGKHDPNSTKLPNGSIMKTILSSDRSDIQPQDHTQAELVRNYFCAMITLVFSGDAKEFMKAAVEAATAEEIPESGAMLMLVASLPSVYERNMKRQLERENLQAYTEQSVPLDQNVGDSVKLRVTVIDSIYKERWGSNAVNVLIESQPGNRVAFFFDRKGWEVGKTYNLTGRIKSKTTSITQLHYVRQSDDATNGKEKK